MLWRQNVAAELTSAVFTEDSSCVLALGKGIFKVYIKAPTINSDSCSCLINSSCISAGAAHPVTPARLCLDIKQ